MSHVGRALKLAFQVEGTPAPTQSALDAAVRHLRRCFPNVFRCDIVITEFGGDNKKTTVTWGDEKGLPDSGAGLHYVETVGIVANAAIPELARRHGWTTK